MSTTTLQQPILIRNTKLGPTVFSDAKSGAEITWGGANDPMGEDVQAVDADLLKNTEFLRSLSRGTFVLEAAPEEVFEALESHLNSPALRRQAQHWQTKQEQEKTTSIESVDHASKNDIVTVSCLGPSTRGDGLCGEAIAVRENAKDEKAPLCALHAQLAPQYVLTEGSGWVRAGLAARQVHQPITS
jgi:hypothetical protein